MSAVPFTQQALPASAPVAVSGAPNQVQTPQIDPPRNRKRWIADGSMLSASFIGNITGSVLGFTGYIIPGLALVISSTGLLIGYEVVNPTIVPSLKAKSKYVWGRWKSRRGSARDEAGSIPLDSGVTE